MKYVEFNQTSIFTNSPLQLQAMDIAILGPPSEGLPVEIENYPKEAPENGKSHVHYECGDKPKTALV